MIKCKRCKTIPKKGIHPEIGKHKYCKCQSELWAEFDKTLWEKK